MNIRKILAPIALFLLVLVPVAQGGEIVCNVCDQNLEVEEVDVEGSPLPDGLDWSSTYDLGEQEPELECPDGQVWAVDALVAPRYEVSNLAQCLFDPPLGVKTHGLLPHDGICGGVPEYELALALQFRAWWKLIVLKNDQALSIPVDYQTMHAVLLSNPDPVEWEFTCAPWYRPGERVVVAASSGPGTAFYSQILLPRFPERCHDRRFTVRAPEGGTAEVQSLLINRRVCEANDGEPVFPDL